MGCIEPYLVLWLIYNQIWTFLGKVLRIVDANFVFGFSWLLASEIFVWSVLSFFFFAAVSIDLSRKNWNFLQRSNFLKRGSSCWRSLMKGKRFKPLRVQNALRSFVIVKACLWDFTSESICCPEDNWILKFWWYVKKSHFYLDNRYNMC